MPGPTRWYPSNAARQRAYRQRRKEEAQEEQEWATLVTTHAYALREAIRQAQRQGDPLARQVSRKDPLDLLRALADHFYDVADTPSSARPWRDPPPSGPRPSRGTMETDPTGG